MLQTPIHPLRSPRLRSGLVAVALLVAAAATAHAAPRLVAIGDVHGDLPAFQAVLREAGVLDASNAWIGGDSVVVQLGDLIDRGPKSRAVFDFVRSLMVKAGKGGGRFVSLLGNHEVMNLVGDLRYVQPENYGEFADAGSAKRQEQAWKEILKWQQARAERRGGKAPELGEAEKTAWLAVHPQGYFEHRAAFGPAGDYGRWLRARPALLVEQGTLFVHGGIAPASVSSTLDAIERKVHDEIALFDELRQGFVKEGLLLPFFDLPEATIAIRSELDALDAVEAAARAAAEANGKEYTTDAKISARRTRFERFLDWGNWSIFASDGPLWYRGYSQWTDAEGAVEMPKLLKAFGVARFVTGHSPGSKGLIRSRFDGAVYLIDTGMLTGYVPGGRGSALELAGDTVTAIYPGATHEVLRPRAGAPAAPSAPLTPAAVIAVSAPIAPIAVTAAPPIPAADPPVSPAPPAPTAPVAPVAAAAPEAPPTAPVAAHAVRTYLGPDGKPLPFASDDELLAFLRDAPVVEVKDIGEGITHPRRLTLEKNGIRARAVFRNVFDEKKVASVGENRREFNLRDYYGFEPAAYRLARLLGFDRVPPADLRRYEGEAGSVQLWIEKATTWGKYKESGTTPPDSLRWKRQLQTMLVWDALVGNTDRNQGNILFGPDWEVWYIDHTRAFRQSTDLREADKIVWCPRFLYEALRAVTDEQIRASVRGLLVPGEVRGLLERRKSLVTVLEKLVKARGETAVLFDTAL